MVVRLQEGLPQFLICFLRTTVLIFSELMKLNLISSDIFLQCMARHQGSGLTVTNPPYLLVVM